MRYMIILITFIFTTNSYALENTQLNISTGELPPYSYTKNGNLTGLAVEIVNELKTRMKYSNKIIKKPWGRVIHESKSSNQLSFPLVRRPYRENSYKWIGPIAQDAVYFYKRKGNLTNIQTIEEAKKVNLISSLHKGLVFSVLQKKGFTNLDPVSNQLSSIKKVVKGRVDLGVNLTPLGIKYYLKRAKLPLDSIELTPVKLIEFPLYIACSKNIPNEIIEDWQKALDKIKESGEYSKIYNKYMK